MKNKINKSSEFFSDKAFFHQNILFEFYILSSFSYIYIHIDYKVGKMIFSE